MSDHLTQFGDPDGVGSSCAPPDIDVADLVEETIAVFGLDMRVKGWNSAAERLYEWKREEVLGRAIQSAVRCSPSEPLASIKATVLDKGVWRGEFARAAKSGRIVVVKVRWSLRRGPDGEVLDIVETGLDLTALRRTEESLSRVNYQYQNLFRASVASFWELEFSEVGEMVEMLIKSGVSDLRSHFRTHPEFVREMIRATRIVDVNEACLHMFGNGNREELMRSLDPLWPDESLPIFAESIISVFERKPHYSAEAVFYSLTGQRFDTLFTVSYPPQILHAARLLVGIVDITEEKRAKAEQALMERRYRDFFHFLPIALFQLESREIVDIFDEARSRGIVDFHRYTLDRPEIFSALLEGFHIVEVNPRAVSMFRAHAATELEGSISRYWTESPEIFRELVSAHYAGRAGYEGAVKMPAHDGTVLDALLFAAFAPVTGDQYVSLVGLIDVSDRVKAQQMLARVQAEMAHAARVSVLGELTASIAHEVSQPLTAIRANTDASLLWMQRTPPNVYEVRELSEQTAVEVQRAADIVERIRSMAIHAEPHKAITEINPVIEEAMLFLRHELQRYEIETFLRLAPQLPIVLADRVQIQQVIVNLAVNAIQAMSLSDDRRRALMIGSMASGEGGVRIEVEDTGKGISEEAMSHLFESFFTTKATGMGIGLPICRSIIESHGGQISVGNRPAGSGARFVIELPSI